MNAFRPIRGSGLGRAAPLRARTRMMGLVALSLAAFLFEGCASLGIGNGGSACGGGCGVSKCGGRLGVCGLRQRLFGRRTAVAPMGDACDPTLGATTVEAGEGAIVTPGPVLAPPPTETNPQLEPNTPGALSPPAGGAGSGTQGNKAGAVKSLYQTQNDGARGGATEARRDTSSRRPIVSGHPPDATEHDPLADLPSLSAPTPAPAAVAAPNVTPAETSPPTPPSAGDRPATETPKPEAAKPDVPKPDAPAAAPATPAETTTGLGPGIRRFKVIEPRFAAGSLPTSAGWKWLVDLGYRTVIDLREPSEVKPDEVADIDHHGLRYLTLPTSAKTIDPARLKRFEEELSREDSRPIFIFDADGTRPASLAFLHLVLAKKTDKRTAERIVEELGGADTPLWQAALSFIADHPATPAPSASTAPAAPPAPAGPSSDAGSKKVANGPDGDDTDHAPISWASYSHIMIAGLGLPLAYFGRTVVSYGKTALASLPAPETTPKSDRPASGG